MMERAAFLGYITGGGCFAEYLIFFMPGDRIRRI